MLALQNRVPSREGPPQTAESVQRALHAMYTERIRAGLCPLCEPVQLLDDFGHCANPFCLFAAFAQPLAVSSVNDPRR